MLISSSASMFDLYFYETKTFSGNFEFYIADVILHLKTCGLRVRLRGSILFPSSTKIWKLPGVPVHDLLLGAKQGHGGLPRRGAVADETYTETAGQTLVKKQRSAATPKL